MDVHDKCTKKRSSLNVAQKLVVNRVIGHQSVLVLHDLSPYRVLAGGLTSESNPFNHNGVAPQQQCKTRLYKITRFVFERPKWSQKKTMHRFRLRYTLLPVCQLLDGRLGARSDAENSCETA